MFIRSERLFLRPGWPEEWADMLALIDDDQIGRDLPQVPWSRRLEEDRKPASRADSLRHPQLVITLPGAQGSPLIGAVGLVDVAGEAELGMCIARGQWNRGFGTEAARALLNLARTLGHRRIVSHRFMDSPASARVLAKLGFAQTGESALRCSPVRVTPERAARYVLSLTGPGNCPGGGDADPEMWAA